MINRRRPIQSTIADRKLFAGGGMIAPLPVENPRGPSGILASSQPLMDVVSQGAVNPMGGGSLSMAHGGLASEQVMAQGFFDGGLGLTAMEREKHRAREALLDPVGGTAANSVFPAAQPPAALSQVNEEDPSNLMQALSGVSSLTPTFPYQEIFPSLGGNGLDDDTEIPGRLSLVGSLINASGPEYSVGSAEGPFSGASSEAVENLITKQVFDGSSQAAVFDNEKLDIKVPAIYSPSRQITRISLNSLLNETAEDASERWMTIKPIFPVERGSDESRAGAMGREVARAAEDIAGLTATNVMMAWRSVFSPDFANKYPDMDLGTLATATSEMQKRHPDLAKEIEQLAARVISYKPTIGVTELKGTVSKILSNKYEIGPYTDFINRVAAEEAEFRNVGLADETGAPVALTEEEIKQLGLADETEAPVALTAEEIKQQFDVGLADETGAPVPRTDAEMEEIAREEAAARAAAARADRVAADKKFGTALTEAHDFAADEDYAAKVEEQYQDDLLKDAPEVAMLGNPDIIAQNKAYMNAQREKLKNTLKQSAVPADETKKLLKDYMDEFKAAMPKYEGMSEEEKGWVALEAGLRVMAGQSPHAITNIAKGLQGLGPEFAKDAKAKREYNRQIGLSAAKYGLEAQRADIEQDRADRRKVWWFYDQTKKDKDNPYGILMPVSMAYLIANKGQLPKGLVEKDLVSKTIVSANANAKILKKSLTSAVNNYQIGDKEADRLTKDLAKSQKALVQSESGIALLGLAKARIAASNLGSFGAGFHELLRRGATAINAPWAKRFTKGKYATMSQARSDVNIALQELIKASLGSTQAANSISNKDVELLAKAYVDNAFTKEGVWDFVGMDMDALGGRLDRAIDVFRERQQDSLRTYDRVQARLEKMESAIARGQKAGLVVDQGPFDRSQFDPYLSAMNPYVSKLRSKGKVPQQNIVIGKSLTTPTGSFVFKDGKYNFTPKSN